MNPTQIVSTPTLARLGGLFYLAIIVCGLFTELYVRSELVTIGNASVTANNILANQGLFRLGFVSDLLMLLFDLALALVLYTLLKPVNHTLALCAAFTRLAMDAILATNLLNHFQALLLLSGADYLAVFSETQLHALVSLSMEAHSVGYAIGLVFFAVHCLILSFLLYRSDLFPKIFGILMVLAGISYLVDSMAKFLLPGYDTTDYVFIMIPALIAEVSFCLWLLIKGTLSPTYDQNQTIPVPPIDQTA